MRQVVFFSLIKRWRFTVFKNCYEQHCAPRWVPVAMQLA